MVVVPEMKWSEPTAPWPLSELVRGLLRQALQCTYNLPSLVRCVPILSRFHAFMVVSLETGLLLVKMVDVSVFVSEDELKGAFEVDIVPVGCSGFGRIRKLTVLAITLPFPERDNKAPLSVSWDGVCVTNRAQNCMQ